MSAEPKVVLGLSGAVERVYQQVWLEGLQKCATLPLSRIVVGDRTRKALGDLAPLTASIKKLGLLHLIVVNVRFELIAGARRLTAVKEPEWKEVPVRVVAKFDDAVMALLAERDENVCRLEFTPSEMVELAKKLEAVERPRARGRQATAGPKEGRGKKRQQPTAEHEPSGSPKFGEPVEAATPADAAEEVTPVERGRTVEKVAAAVGTSKETLRKAKVVVAAAEKEPARFGRVVEEMDATGKVDPAYRQVTEPQKGDQERPDKQELRIYVEDASIPARTLMIDAEGRVGAAHSPDVGIQEGPELEQANTLADVPPGHWNDWLTRHHGPKRGAGLKHDGRFLLDNLKVIEAAPPFSRMSLGCGTFEEVLDYFDLTTEQWEWLKAGEGILFPLGAAPCGDHAG